jgi:hypothetical protein
MLPQQIKQVGMTYVTQRYLWWGALALSLMVGPQFLLAGSSRRSPTDAAQPMLMLLGMPMFVVVPFLVAQVKSQFAHSRAHLLPRFHVPHLTVLGAILISFALLYPVALARIAGFEPIGLLALACAMMAPAIWAAHFNRFLPVLVTLGVFYSLLTDWGLRWWVVDAAAHRPVHAMIVVTGVVLIAAWLWRLCHLTEEMDDYEGFHRFMLARRSGAEVVELRRMVASQIGRNRLMSWIGDAWHERLGGYYGGNKTALVRLLRYGFAANPVEVQGIFMGAMFFAFALFMGQFSYVANSSGRFGGVWFLIVFAVLLPGHMAGETMAQRRGRIAAEMTLPLRRSDLIDGLFAAAVRNSVILWLMMNVVMVILVVTSLPQMSLREPTLFLLFSGSALFASVGLSLRTAVWPSMFKRFISLWGIWMVFMVPTMAWWFQRNEVGDAPFLLIPIALVAFGALFFRSARRAWLNLELG